MANGDKKTLKKKCKEKLRAYFVVKTVFELKDKLKLGTLRSLSHGQYLSKVMNFNMWFKGNQI